MMEAWAHTDNPAYILTVPPQDDFLLLARAVLSGASHKRPSAQEEFFMSDQINSEPVTIEKIDEWLGHWVQNDLWDKIVKEKPDIANLILKKRSIIEEELGRFKNGRATFAHVDWAVQEYGEAWRKVKIAFLKQ